jgi:hypothetical protein
MDPIYPSLAISILGILIAVYQGFEKKRLSRYLRSQSWYIYSMSLLSWSVAQTALKKYKEVAGEKLNPDIFESLSKCDAYNLSLSLESIRQIQLSEPRFDLETITTWAMQGKIPKDHTSLFLRILSLEPPGTLRLFWKTFIMRLTMNLQKKMIAQPSKVNDPKQDSQIKDEVGKS